MKDKILINDKTYDVLFTLNDEKKDINYVVYTDNSKDEKGNARVYLGRYKDSEILPLKGEEKEELEEIVKLMSDEVNKYESN